MAREHGFLATALLAACLALAGPAGAKVQTAESRVEFLAP
jgi:hypothetical protein